MPQISNIQQRIRLLLIFTLACFTVCGLLTLRTLSEIKVNGPIYERIKLDQDLIADVLPPPGYLLESYLTAIQFEAERDDGERRARLKNRLTELQNEYHARFAYWNSVALDPGLHDLFLIQSDRLARNFFDEVQTNLEPAVEAHDTLRAQVSMRRLQDMFEQQHAIIDKVVVQARALNLADEASAGMRITQLSAILLIMAGLAIFALMLAFHRTGTGISQPIQRALETTRQIASGDWAQSDAEHGDDEAGQIVKAAQDIVRGAQAELVRAEKLAALGSLVAGISHELNTPIGNGLLAVSALTREVEMFKQESRDGVRRSSLERFTQAAEEAAEIAQRNIERAATLIRSFKQVAVDRTTSQRRKFMLDRVIRETVVTLQPLFKRAQVELIERVPVTVAMDSFPGSLGQVISNLVENAVVHGFNGAAGTIVIEAELRDAGSAVLITVRDDGKGVPDAIRERIFDPFFTTRLGQGGSGLGLHIAYNIVTGVLGGELRLRSSASGAVFEIRVPLVAPTDAATVEAEAVSPWVATGPASFA